jgi:phosphorylcholine metabolism protein LicD
VINSDDRHKLSDISFSTAFFEDEVREGFFVMSMMKRYWAGQLKVLSVIDGICRKLGINWFADYGTLMGAVRHEGYIPWDDDLDICMLRSDWNRFFEAAKRELPKGYVIMTLDTQEEYSELIGRVCNSHAIDFSDEHLEEFYGCPYTVGVDIFPLDGLYDDPEKEEERKNRAKKILDAYDIARKDGEKSYKLRYLIQDIERDNNVKLKMRDGLVRELLHLIDKVYSECSDIGVKKVALMRYYMSDGNHIYDRKMYEPYVELPFENTYVRVPSRYDEKLRLDYGNYMNVVKSGGLHSYPVYAEQELIFKQHIGHNPYRYTLDTQELLISVSRYIMKATSQYEVKQNRKIIFLPCRAKWWNTMEELWSRAVAGTDLEVHVLPIPFYDRDFTGKVFNEHYEKELFPDYVGCEDYEDYNLEKNHPDVIVMQMPYDDWSTSMMVAEHFFSRNLIKCCDELIYIPCFDPEDSEMDGDKADVAIRILAEQPAVVNADKVVLKSERMKQVYIKKLVELTGEPTRDYWNHKLVMKDGLDWGEDNVTANRLSATDDDSEWESLVGDVTGKKVVIYYVSISFLLQGGSRAIDKIRKSLAVFAESDDGIKLVLLPQRAIIDDLERIDKQLWNKFEEIVQEVGKTWKNCVYDPYGISADFVDKWNAFYGDPGALPRQCVLKHKPVMIQNLDL